MKGPEERESSRANVSSVAGWTKSKTRSAETMFPARNESECSGGRHLHVRETRQVRWQNGLEFRDEGLCESHRSAAG